MNNALKGLLLSGLVLPGLGQYALGRRLRGVLFMAVTLTGLALVVVKIVRVLLAFLTLIEKQALPPSLADLPGLLWRATTQAGGAALPLLLVMVSLCWLWGTADAYFIGRRLDRASDRASS